MAMQVSEVGRTAPPTMQITCNSTQYNTMVHSLMRTERAGVAHDSIRAHHMLEEMESQFPDTSIGCVCELHKYPCYWGASHRA